MTVDSTALKHDKYKQILKTQAISGLGPIGIVAAIPTPIPELKLFKVTGIGIETFQSYWNCSIGI